MSALGQKPSLGHHGVYFALLKSCPLWVISRYHSNGGIGLFSGPFPTPDCSYRDAALKPPPQGRLLKSVKGTIIRGVSNAYHSSARPFGSFALVERLLPPQSSGLRGTAAAAGASTT